MINVKVEQALQSVAIKFDDHDDRILGSLGITHFQIDRTINSMYITGSLCFTDTWDLVEIIPLNSNTKLTVSMLDCQGVEFSEVYIATDIKSKPVGNKTNEVEITFIDIDSFYLICQTSHEVFSEKTGGAIIKELLEQYKKSEKELFFVENTNPNIIQKHVMKGNKTVLANIDYLLRSSNLKLIRRRKEIVLKSYDKLVEEAKIFGFSYVFNNLNPYYMYQIKELKIIKMGTGSLPLSTPKTKVFSVDPTDLRMQMRVYSPNETHTDQTVMVEKEIDYVPDVKARSVYSQVEFVEESMRSSYSNIVNESNILEILVPGTYDSPDIGDKVNVKRETVDRSDSYKPDTNISGYWIVQSVSDLYVSQNIFMLKLILTRSGCKDKM